MTISERTRGLISINAVAMIVGSSALYGKMDADALWIVAGRSGFCALVLMLIGIHGRRLLVPWRFAPALVLAGLVLAAHWASFFAAIQAASVAVATLAFSAFPLFTVLIDAAGRRRWPHPLEIVATGAIIVAIALLTTPGGDADAMTGVGLGLLSGLLYAIYWRINKPLNGPLSHLQITAWQNLVTALACAPFLFVARPVPETMLDWALLALLGGLNTALMIIFYLYALQRLPASTCSGIIALEPVYAILFAGILFGEPVTLLISLSALLILASSWTLLRVSER